jgi:hypothetical protein
MLEVSLGTAILNTCVERAHPAQRLGLAQDAVAP